MSDEIDFATELAHIDVSCTRCGSHRGEDRVDIRVGHGVVACLSQDDARLLAVRIHALTDPKETQ